MEDEQGCLHVCCEQSSGVRRRSESDIPQLSAFAYPRQTGHTLGGTGDISWQLQCGNLLAGAGGRRQTGDGEGAMVTGLLAAAEVDLLSLDVLNPQHLKISCVEGIGERARA